MKVILKENVKDLGKTGDVVNVSDGYARNFLIPRGLVIEASNKNVKTLEHEKRLIAKKVEREKEKAQLQADRIAGMTITVFRKVGEQEKLFGSVTTKDVETALSEQNIEMDRKNIILEEPIKSLGEFPVKVKLHREISVEITVIVKAEE
ncbi:MAG: 50S ribosomal protein L9 [Deltaproteobacteria bacterium]|nr:50S ribosomal protein L9 [Deltaproteobacteria bacterium]